MFAVVIEGCTEVLHIEALDNGSGYELVVFRALKERSEAPKRSITSRRIRREPKQTQ